MMISNLTPSGQQFLNNMNRINANMERAQREVSTGIRLSQVSDDPDQVSTLLQARAGLGATKQKNSNLVQTKAEVDAAEQTMQTAVGLFERIQTLAAQGASTAQTADTRATLAGEAGSILEQLGGLASTQVAGRFIFSGDSDQVVPYTIDLTQSNPVSAYKGSDATRVAQHPNGTTFRIGATAQTIFDSADPTTSVFGAIQAVRTALDTNDDAGIHSALGSLSKVSRYLNSQLSFYGTAQNKVTEATDFGLTLQTQFEVQVGSIENADLTQSILELTQAQTQQQASLQARAQLPRTTLFDFLG